MDSLGSSLKERDEKFKSFFDSSLSSVTSMFTAKLKECLREVKGSGSSDINSPLEEKDEDIDPQEGPSRPMDQTGPFSEILEVPDPVLWKGMVASNCLYFVDNIGFGWCVDLKTEDFSLLSDVFDVSSFFALA